MNSAAVYVFPGKTVFGCGAYALLKEYLPGNLRRPLVVAGKSAAASKEGREILSSLAECDPVTRIGIPAEPPLDCVDGLVEKGRAEKVSCVIALGGGSVIDAAKAAAALIPLEGSVREYFTGARSIPGKGLFFAALPTTAGTGAESTANSVLTDPETKIKKSLRHPLMRADLALVDPLLTFGCPAELTAASGLDAFVQAFECYTNPKATALTRALSARSAKGILESLETACREPRCAAARTAMAEASMLAGLAFSQTGLGAVHGFAHPAGSLLHVPHGVACAILMTPVMRWNAPVCGELYAELARFCGTGSTAEDFIAAADGLRKRLGIPDGFGKYGISRKDFPFLVKNCRSASMNSNPRPFTDAEAEAFLENLL